MPIHQYLPHFLGRQFKTISSDDFPGVVIPLEHAERHHSVVEKAEKDAVTALDVEKGSDSSGKDVGRRGSVPAYDVHTIEGLRAEIENDLTAFGASDSAYDRTYTSLTPTRNMTSPWK